jgi:hypothetical protein
MKSVNNSYESDSRGYSAIKFGTRLFKTGKVTSMSKYYSKRNHLVSSTQPVHQCVGLADGSDRYASNNSSCRRKQSKSYYFWSKEYLRGIVCRREHKLQYSSAPGVAQFRWKLDSDIRLY